MITQFDLERGARRLGAYDLDGPGAVVFWQHGTPNLGTPPAPLVRAVPGLRWLSLDRPGYGCSTRSPGRRVADPADDVEAVADHLGVDRFVLAGHSGGGPHALATAARLGERVLGVLAISTLAPITRFPGPTEFLAGMGPHGTATLRAALSTRAEKERFEAAGGSGGVDFTPADWAALQGEWGWFDEVVQPALAGAVDGVVPGLVDDDLAYVADWGVDLARVSAPVLLLHGEDDLIAPVAHARAVADAVLTAELRVVPGAGHLSVLEHAAGALRSVLPR